MLKWAVGGHHQARAEPPCCSAIRRPPFKRAKRNTAAVDKENDNGSCSRDSSVYMRLEALPVALRDVSNHQTPPADVRLSPRVKRPRTCSSPTKLEVEKKIKEEKKKLPCAVDHGKSRVCLDPERSLFQIEYTPGPQLVPRSPGLDDPVYFLDHSPSPVELDHKEIPLEQRKKDIILSTPGRLVIHDSTMLSESTPRTTGVSPLARRFAFLELSRTTAGSDLFDSPAEIPFQRPSFLSTTATIPMPLLPPTLPECETLKAWVEANRHLDTTTPVKQLSDTSSQTAINSRKPTASSISVASSVKTFIINDEQPRHRITNPTNHDRNSASCESLEFKSPIFEGSLDDAKVKSILVNRYSSLPSISESGIVVDSSRKRRGVVFNDTMFSLNTPPSDEERSSSLTWSVDGCAPSTLKRQRVVRRRRRDKRHPISELSSGRLGLTLPDGIPSPPSPSDLALPLRSPTWGSTTESLATTLSSSSNRVDYEADSSSAGSSATVSPSCTETDSGSRRCLLFSSPHRTSRRSSIHSPRPGELELLIYYKNGLLTIHVIRGRNLQALSGPCNAYIKVCLVGCGTYRRTCVKKDSNNPRFDQSFSFQLSEEDLDRRILVSAWHRDRSNRKSEFLGCMSFAVRNVLKKDIQGRYRLLSQGSGRLGHLPATSNSHVNSADVMANHSESSVEELVSVDDSDVPATPEAGGKERKRLNSTRKDYGKVIEDYIFLRYLELDPVSDEQSPPPVGTSSGTSRRGRTPFTTTRTLRRQPGNSFGFSIAWTHPPRVERVESGLPADQAGLRPGDYIIFVEKSNVVTMKEEQILEIIKSCGNQIVLESYRKAPATGGRPLSHPGAVAVSPRTCSTANACATAPGSANACSTAACSAATTTASLEVSKKRLHFPHVTFTSEVGSGILV